MLWYYPFINVKKKKRHLQLSDAKHSGITLDEYGPACLQCVINS